jgi:hypothetical protein
MGGLHEDEDEEEREIQRAIAASMQVGAGTQGSKLFFWLSAIAVTMQVCG